jgi:hypothetical protein
MRSIEVTGDGMTITDVTGPHFSVFGKRMSPGSTGVSALPWDLIHRVSIEVLELSPDGERWVTLVVDLIYGEFIEIPVGANGFTETAETLCRLSGLPVPPDGAPAGVWPAP